jgi:nucleoside 2-deoxyribosyltransferase
MPRVFFSYGKRDADFAIAISAELRKYGVEESLSHGDGYRASKKAAIRGADAFVLVLGEPELTTSTWVSYELGMAEALGKPILLLLSHKHATAELPVDMAGLPIVPFDPEHPELAAQEVVDRLLAAA